MQIAVIGAGMAGLTLARQLQAQGHHLTVYEKNAEVSGRLRTRETELGGFDHGAQYFTAKSARFKKEIADWSKFGWVAPWQGRLVAWAGGKVRAAGGNYKRYVALPGMGSLGKQLAHGLDVRLEQRVLAIAPHGRQWRLELQSDTVPVAASAGPFDAVLLAIPADQAAALLTMEQDFAQQLRSTAYAPCLALLLGFQNSLDLPYDGAWIESSRLAWIARDTAKPAHRVGERWVCHASAAWSREHLLDDPERVKEKLSKAFHEVTGSRVQPILAQVQRWPFALAEHPLPADCLWNPATGIGVCGDAFAAGQEGAGRVENAFLSALALAAAVS